MQVEPRFSFFKMANPATSQFYLMEIPAGDNAVSVTFSSGSERGEHFQVRDDTAENERKKFQCEHCDMSFEMKGNLNRHTRTHTNERNHECKVCGMRFKEKHHKNNHEKRHAKWDRANLAAKPFPCTLCDCGYSTNGNLQKHMKSRHQVGEKRTGKEQRKVQHSNSPRGMSHMHEHEPSQEQATDVKRVIPRIQEENSRTFAQALFQEPELSVDTVVPVKIERAETESETSTLGGELQQLSNSPVARKCFVALNDVRNKLSKVGDIAEQWQDSMTEMDTTGTGSSTNEQSGKVSNLNCKFCGETLPSLFFLRQHELNHNSQRSKPYKCQLCRKSFSWSKFLVQHMKFHVADDKLNCSKCGKCFARRRALQIHMKRHKLDERQPVASVNSKQSTQLTKSLDDDDDDDGVYGFDDDVELSDGGDGIDGLRLEETDSSLPQEDDPNLIVDGAFDHRNETDGEEDKEDSDWEDEMDISDNEPHFKESEYPGAVTRRSARLGHKDSSRKTHSEKKKMRVKPAPVAKNAKAVKGKTGKSRPLKSEEKIVKDKNVRCEHCSENFRRKKDFIAHLKQAHPKMFDEYEKMNMYMCQYCGKHYKNRTGLNIHEMTHTGEFPFECETCGKKFIRKEGYKRHLKWHDDSKIEKRHQCPGCIEKFALYDNLALHWKFKHEDLVASGQSLPVPDGDMELENAASKLYCWPCATCGKEFKSKEYLGEHKKRHGEPQFHCTYCEKSFHSKGDMKMHMTRHNMWKSFDCPHCDFKGKTQSVVKTHIINKHLDQVEDQDSKVHRCKHCPKYFAKKSALKYHLNRAHPALIEDDNERLPVCEQCSMCFKSASALVKHTKNHSKQMRYMCKVCGKQFRWEHHKEEHEEKHGEKRVPCSLCHKKFASERHLKRHQYDTHSQQHQCSICGRTFSRKSTLKDHFALHTENKPFVCQKCGRTYAIKKTLIVHQQTCIGYQCLHCKEMFTSKMALSEHSKTHMGSTHQCQYCGLHLETLEAMKPHLELHDGKPPFTCHFCKKEFNETEALKLHTAVHLVKITKQSHCKVCNKNFPSAKDLANHDMTECPEKKYQCPLCQKLFQTYLLLTRHRRVHKRKQWACSKCDQVFVVWQQKLEHDKTHILPEDLICKVCNKKFSSPAHLRSHQRHHGLGNVEVFCRYCNKKYFSKRDCRDHENVHTGNEPYACTLCGKTFKFRTGLFGHKRSAHDNKKSIHEATPCEICGKVFSRKYSLERHIKRIHNSAKRDSSVSKPAKVKVKVRKTVKKTKNQVKKLGKQSRPCKCPGCKSSFHTLESLLKHVEKRHGFDKTGIKKLEKQVSLQLQEIASQRSASGIADFVDVSLQSTQQKKMISKNTNVERDAQVKTETITPVNSKSRSNKVVPIQGDPNVDADKSREDTHVDVPIQAVPVINSKSQLQSSAVVDQSVPVIISKSQLQSATANDQYIDISLSQVTAVAPGHDEHVPQILHVPQEYVPLSSPQGSLASYNPDSHDIIIESHHDGAEAAEYVTITTSSDISASAVVRNAMALLELTQGTYQSDGQT